MSEASKTLLSHLVALSKVDGALARIAASKKKIDTELSELHKSVKRSEADKTQRHKVSEDRKSLYQKEDRKIKEEREKLIARRKALTTLSNYKLQQAAEREIEHSSKQLDQHEEGLVTVLDEVDKLSSEFDAANSRLIELSATLQKVEGDSREALIKLEEEQRQLLQEKSTLLNQVDSKTVIIYERVAEKYPGSAVVKIEKESCSGCFMQLGPQTVVQVLKGDAVIKCRGCGRIVYVSD